MTKEAMNLEANTHEGDLRVLASPAGYLISDKTGSDPGAVYELLRLLGGTYGVEFYAIVNRVDLRENLPEKVKLIEIGVNYGGSMFEQVVFYLKCFRMARKILREKKPDIVHHILLGYGGSFNLLAVSDDIDTPFIVGPIMYNVPLPPELRKDIRLARWGRLWSDLWSPSEDLREKLLEKAISCFGPMRRRLFEKTLQRCDVLVVVNNFTKKACQKVVNSSKIRIIPLGVDTRKFPYTPPPMNHDILMLGAHQRRKGFQYLIKAMPKIVKEIPEARLHILGDGPYRTNLMKLTKDLMVSNHVYFHGFVSHTEIPYFYKACRLFCLPTLHECFGLVIVEAMASGRPVVSTDSVGPREIVADGETGFIVPMADSDALAERIMSILNDYELSYKMGAEGRKVAEEKYDWNVIARQYYHIYRLLAP